jgi:glycosyltransferase involved in cell wall biosynthesis
MRMGSKEKIDNVCMVVFSYYPADPRVRREAEALVEAGMRVEVVCLRGEGQAKREEINGVTARRLPIRRTRGGKLRYILEYLLFFVAAFFAVCGLSLRRRIGIVHAHNMPDFLIFTGLLPRLLGGRTVLDLHDPTPEVFQTKYGIEKGGRTFKLLAFVERISIRFASLVLTPNIRFKEVFGERGCPSDKIKIVMNSPDESIFREEMADEWAAEGRDGDDKTFKVMFHGGIYERHGLNTALEAIARVRAETPDLRLEVYGDGDHVEAFQAMVAELGLGDVVRYRGSVPLETIARAIPKADIGLIANNKSPFTLINMPTRIFEYLAMGRPVIAPRTPGILDYFGEEELFFFEPGDAEDLGRALVKAYRDREARERVLTRARPVYQKHAWRLEKQGLVQALRGLVNRGATAGSVPAARVEVDNPNKINN